MTSDFGYKRLCGWRRKNNSLSSLALAILYFLGLLQSPTMPDLEFSRNQDGNYQATLGNVKVTVQIYLNKVYVDVRDHFAKAPGQPADTPTKRGVTMTLREWQLLSESANKTYYDLQKLYIAMANDQKLIIPDVLNVTSDLKQTVEINSNGPRVVLTKLRGNEAYSTRNTATITLHPWTWYNVFSVNSAQVCNLASLLQNEASRGAEKRKLTQLDWTEGDDLFKATWDLPLLQTKNPTN